MRTAHTISSCGESSSRLSFSCAPALRPPMVGRAATRLVRRLAPAPLVPPAPGAAPARPAAPPPPALLAELDGTTQPVSAEYVTSGIEQTSRRPQRDDDDVSAGRV